jgi:hypothetical protein
MSDVTTKTPTRFNPDRRVQVAVRLSPGGLAAVDALAEEEDRTRSDMVRVLLVEAVTARKRKKELGR